MICRMCSSRKRILVGFIVFLISLLTITSVTMEYDLREHKWTYLYIQELPFRHESLNTRREQTVSNNAWQPGPEYTLVDVVEPYLKSHHGGRTLPSRNFYQVLHYNEEANNYATADNAIIQSTCAYRNCVFTNNRTLFRNSSAVIFSLSHGKTKMEHALPRKIPGQVWVFYDREPPVVNGKFFYRHHSWRNAMNWSMSYSWKKFERPGKNLALNVRWYDVKPVLKHRFDARPTLKRLISDQQYTTWFTGPMSPKVMTTDQDQAYQKLRVDGMTVILSKHHYKTNKQQCLISEWHCNISYVCEMALTRCWTTWSTGYKIAFAQPQTLVSVADLCKSASELVLSGLVHLRLDSDIVFPYGTFRSRDPGEIPPKDYSAIYRKKTKFAFWLVSNCNSMVFSGRNEYVNELKKYVPIDIYGACGEPVGDDISELFAQYKFYLSFENSFCKGYVTEKFFGRFSEDVVLVVRGGVEYDQLFPGDTFVSAGSFMNAASLAQALIRLNQSEILYTEFLRRKDKYVYNGMMNWQCQMCAKLNNQDEHRNLYENIVSYWNANVCWKPSDFQPSIWKYYAVVMALGFVILVVTCVLCRYRAKWRVLQ